MKEVKYTASTIEMMAEEEHQEIKNHTEVRDECQE